MAQRRPVKLPGMRAYLEEVTQVTAQEAATQIVERLISLGPWYSGQFARNWEVRLGDTAIPATVEPPEKRGERTPREEVNLPTIPSLRGTGSKKVVGYTIDNRTTYRRIAMDLEPGRTESAQQISAPKDWYVNFIQGGGLSKVLKNSVGAAAKNPRVRGFKAKGTNQSLIGPLELII